MIGETDMEKIIGIISTFLISWLLIGIMSWINDDCMSPIGFNLFASFIFMLIFSCCILLICAVTYFLFIK